MLAQRSYYYKGIHFPKNSKIMKQSGIVTEDPQPVTEPMPKTIYSFLEAYPKSPCLHSPQCDGTYSCKY